MPQARPTDKRLAQAQTTLSAEGAEIETEGMDFNTPKPREGVIVSWSRSSLYWRVVTLALVFAGMALPAAGFEAAREVVSERVMRRHGFDPDRLKRLDGAIEQAIEADRIAGALMLIGRGGEHAYLRAYGRVDREGGKSMQPDTIFRIASMSKALTSVAVMILLEEGRFMLNDPVWRYLPAFKDSVVAVPAPADAAPGVTYVTVPAERAITIRHLLTHTAGLTYGDGLARDAYRAAGFTSWYFSDRDETIAECVDRLAALPLHAHPGTKWQYGYATDVLGRLIEVVSGQPLDRFMADRVFGPLKMTDTSFFLPPGKVERLAPVYGVEEGRLVLKETAATSDFVVGPRKCFSGGAGLLSTITDYGRFLQMLLNEGELDGVRVLSPASVRLMHENHTADLYQRDTAGFGLGFWVNNDPGHYGELVPEGAYGWGSAYFPQYVVDPANGMYVIFMTQLRPAGSLDLNQKMKNLTYQALVR